MYEVKNMTVKELIDISGLHSASLFVSEEVVRGSVRRMKSGVA
jgi:hypothetical protein